MDHFYTLQMLVDSDTALEQVITWDFGARLQLC